MKRSPWITPLAAAALTLALLAGCGGRPDQPAPPPDSGAAEQDRQEERSAFPGGEEEPVPPAGGEEETVPPAGKPEEKESAAEPAPSASPTPPAAEPASPTPPAPPAAEPASAPAAPEPAPAPALEDGSYTAAVTLEGGTGRASVSSPAQLRCENGQFWATIVWSSSNFDYMKVDGERYELLSAGGNSTFEIPVAAFDQKLEVIADTVAMSEPHEVAYTLYFDSATLQKQ